MFPERIPLPATRSVGSADESLIARIREGDVGAFNGLFHELWQPLCHYAFAYVRSVDEAEDVVQTVFARVWRNHQEWRVAGTVREYLFVATRNVSLDRLKHDRVSQNWREQIASETDVASPAGPMADADLANQEIAAAVERAFAALPAKRRRICELRLTGQLSYAEIAQQLQIAPKTVETQVARGLKQLRAALIGQPS